jgi:hypothetical protein
LIELREDTLKITPPMVDPNREETTMELTKEVDPCIEDRLTTELTMDVPVREETDNVLIALILDVMVETCKIGVTASITNVLSPRIEETLVELTIAEETFNDDNPILFVDKLETEREENVPFGPTIEDP